MNEEKEILHKLLKNFTNFVKLFLISVIRYVSRYVFSKYFIRRIVALLLYYWYIIFYSKNSFDSLITLLRYYKISGKEHFCEVLRQFVILKYTVS